MHWQNLSSFGFFSVGFCVGKKPNVLNVGGAFPVCRTTPEVNACAVAIARH